MLVKYLQLCFSSLAYETALTYPPDGKAHPTFLVRQEAANLSLIFCTLHRVITRHTLIGSYTQRFFPQLEHTDTQEQVACPCGEPVQTVERVLLECHWHTAARRRHLTAFGAFKHPELVQFVGLLRFMEETGACASRDEWHGGTHIWRSSPDSHATTTLYFTLSLPVA
jgi:hypothetical protein